MSTTAQSDSIAVIGLSARLPGAPDVESYWLNLREGVESVVRHSREELLARGVRPGLVDDPHYVAASADLDDADCFDAAFFGYSAREASVIDPQHRIFLECAYHALEDAGYGSRRYGGLVGLYAGCTMNTYLLYNVMARSADVVATIGDLQTMVGNDKDYLTTRVSYKLDLRGPSVDVQSACSSSLVAIHMACRALLDQECDIALAGGSSVRVPLAGGYLANPGGTSSPDGHCRAFDADAAGSVVGNGVGVVVLKRLADAVRDGDRIEAIVLGSAINNDGQAKASFTAPSVEGQSRAVTRALRRAGVSARDIAFVECHGTGTPLGDPIEVAALSRAFRQWTSDTGYCWLGSVKPNIGHLDAAAGVAGFIKAVLALKHRQVPPVLHFRRPNPRLELETTPFLVPTELSPLASDGPLVASVNSLAMGGTNAHLILQEAPGGRASGPSPRRRHPVVVSARSPESLEGLSRSVGQWAREHPAAELADVAYTLATGRREHEFRRVILAGSLEDVAFGFSARGSRRQHEARARDPQRTVFLFPGQGTQRIGMGARLAEADAVFARHLGTVLDLFRDTADLDIRSALYPDGGDTPEARSRLAETQLTQPALFAVEWSLGRTLIDYGVQAYAMLGHSIGELVAAALADVFPLVDAVRLVSLRAALMSDTPEGAMLYVNLPVDDIAGRLADPRLAVAAVNAPGLVVVSGPPDEIDRLGGELRAEGTTCGRLDVTRAFHSPLIEPAAARLEEGISGLALSEPSIPVVSNVSGGYLTAAEATRAAYWGDQARRPVRFADGVRTLIEDGATIFVEVGPGRSLCGLARATGPDIVTIPVLTAEDGSDAGDLLEPLTRLWLEGGNCDWAAYYSGEERARISLPPYPFARARHWLEARPGHEAHAGTPAESAAINGDGRAGGSSSSFGTPGDAALTPTQRYLARLWHELLGVEDIGLHDNFFDLNGHSLLAMQMVTQLRTDGADDLELTAVFDMPTIAGLAGHLDSQGFTAPEPSREPAARAGGTSQADEPEMVLAGDDAALVARIESMSDDEVRELLAQLEGSGEP